MDALGDGEVDMIYPPALCVSDGRDSRNRPRRLGHGPRARCGSTSASIRTTRLQNLFIRQAIAQGINRDAIVEEVVRPITPDGLLGNAVWLHNSLYYQDHFNRLFPYDPIAAEALLTDNGCVEGEDVIYECGGERLSFLGRPHPATRLGTCTSSWPRPTSPQSDRDNTQLRADIRAPADEQPAGGGRRLAGHEPGLGRLTGPVLGQLPLLLPGQRLERIRRTELLPYCDEEVDASSGRPT